MVYEQLIGLAKSEMHMSTVTQCYAVCQRNRSWQCSSMLLKQHTLDKFTTEFKHFVGHNHRSTSACAVYTSNFLAQLTRRVIIIRKW